MSEKKPFSVKEFLEVKMNKRMTENPKVVDGFDCVYQFEIDEHIWNLDLLNSSDREIKKGRHDDPDCSIIVSGENFEKLVRGKLNVPLALISGKIKIKGDKTLALKLAKLFS
jgi:putative sterol carrier protein